MALQEGDFVKLDYTGKDLETGEVFDTTKQDVAKENDLFSPKTKFGQVTICIGQGHLLPGLDKALIGAKEQGNLTVKVEPLDGFGKKDAKAIKLMPKKLFIKQKINPQPGLEVNIDGTRGTIKSISGNRVIVDFNHPLAGHELEYVLETSGRVTDHKEQVQTLIENALRFKPEVKVEGAKATVETPFDFPEQLQEELGKQIKERTDITEVSFESKESKSDA